MLEKVREKPLSHSALTELTLFKTDNHNYYPPRGSFELTANHPVPTVFVEKGNTMKFESEREFWLRGPASTGNNKTVIRKMHAGTTFMTFSGAGVLVLEASIASGSTKVKVTPSEVGFHFSLGGDGRTAGMHYRKPQRARVTRKTLTQEAESILQLGKH